MELTGDNAPVADKGAALRKKSPIYIPPEDGGWKKLGPDSRETDPR